MLMIPSRASPRSYIRPLHVFWALETTKAWSVPSALPSRTHGSSGIPFSGTAILAQTPNVPPTNCSSPGWPRSSAKTQGGCVQVDKHSFRCGNNSFPGPFSERVRADQLQPPNRITPTKRGGSPSLKDNLPLLRIHAPCALTGRHGTQGLRADVRKHRTDQEDFFFVFIHYFPPMLKFQQTN